MSQKTVLVTGASSRDGSSERLRRSPNFKDGRFHNTSATRLGLSAKETLEHLADYFRGMSARSPSAPLPARKLPWRETDLREELQVTWLGHSTCLIEMEGMVILTDPMFGDRASPVPFFGPKRFAVTHDFSIGDLPRIDVVLISHDHYDHLDYGTILALKEKTERFYVPLGVGEHLKRWGAPSDRIFELDWWEKRGCGPLTFTATPTRHFSGRSLTDRNRTLWASWAIAGTKRRVFFSGDSGYFSGFREIGERLGPFDLTLLECGAYDASWPDIHMMPEHTVQAHVDLRGKALLPIHWAKFDLAMHPWSQPVERLLKEAARLGVTVTTPMIGEAVRPGMKLPQGRWWEGTFEAVPRPKETSRRLPAERGTPAPVPNGTIPIAVNHRRDV